MFNSFSNNNEFPAATQINKNSYEKWNFHEKSALLNIFGSVTSQEDLECYRSIKINLYLQSWTKSWTEWTKFFHFLVQILFTTSEMALDYYLEKVIIRVVSRVAERLKTEDLGN